MPNPGNVQAGQQPLASRASVGYLRQFNFKDCDWTIYKTQLLQYFLVNEVTSDEFKRALLINSCDEESYKLLHSLCVPKNPTEMPFKDLIEKFDKHFESAKLYFPERYKFYNATMNAGETISEWAARVRSLAVKCKFGTELKIVLRDKFIMGIPKGPILDKLFEEDVEKLEFEAAIEIANTKEASRYRYEVENVPEIKSEPEEVYKMSQDSRRRTIQGGSSRSTGRPWMGASCSSAPRPGSSQGPSSGPPRRIRCTVCGKQNHDKSKCFYSEYECKRCGIKGHLASVCTGKSSERNNYYLDVDDDIEGLYNLRSTNNEPIIVDVKINGIPMSFEIDTGASVSVINDEFRKKYFAKVPVSIDNKILSNYDGNHIFPLGYINVRVQYNGKVSNLKLYVIDNGGPPLLGRDFFCLFELTIHKLSSKTDVDSIITEFPTVFSNELGLFNKGVIHLNVEEGCSPKFFKPRPLPFAMKKKVEEELGRLLELGILKPVEYSEWGTPIVPVLKRNGSVRICGDYKVTLNSFLKVEHYPMPRIEELFAKLSGGKEFTKIDLSQAYQQISLDKESWKYTTISTHRGLFSYTRLPFGIACAPQKFQRIMEKILQGLDGVVSFLDDILITGENREIHLQRVHNVLLRLKDCGLTVRLDKCEFFKKNS